MSGILTVTMNPALDVTASVAEMVPREKLRCTEPTRELGGGGINVSRVIAAFGGTSRTLVVAGGLTGQQMIRMLEDRGFDPVVVPCAGSTRESIMIFDRAVETQYRFIMPGPSLTDAEWQNALDTASAAAQGLSYVVASGSLPPGCPDDFYCRLARACAPVPMIVDTSGAALRAVAREPVFCLKMDEEEVEDLCPGAPDERTAAEDVRARSGAHIVLLTLGARGLLAATADGVIEMAGRKVKPVSTVGAGDSLVAGMVKALDDGLALPEALAHGVAAGTAAVLTPGTELARRSDFDRVLTEMRADQGVG